MYILTDENGFIIKKINSKEKPKQYKDAIEFNGFPEKGKNIDEYNADGTLKTLKERYDLGFVKTPAGNEWDGEKFIISEIKIKKEELFKQLQSKKIQEVKNWYEQEKREPVNGFYSEILGAEINGGKEQYEDIMSLVVEGDEECKEFVLLDNTVAIKDAQGNLLNAKIFRKVCSEMTMYTKGCYWTYQAKRKQIYSCKTKEELEEIKI